MAPLTAARRFARHVGDGIVLLRGLLTDRRVPRRVRWVARLALLSLVSPIDLIPDFIPVIGHLDDALVLVLAARYAIRRVPPGVLTDHWRGDPALLATLRGAAH